MLISTYVLAWKLYWASWNKDWKTQQKLIAEMGSKFDNNGIPVISTQLWNVIIFTGLQLVLIRAAGFSAQFQQFYFWAVYIPCQFCSLFFYAYKYGLQACWNNLTFSSLLTWIKNWITMHGITFCCLTQTAICYSVAKEIQPYVLPKSWQFSVRFPAQMYENYLRALVWWFASLMVICVITLPLHKKGYALSMEVAGRSNKTSISYKELILELVYQTCHSGQGLFSYIPIVIMLQNYLEMRIYCIHFILFGLEMILINYAFQFKFCIFHQLNHEIPQLYAMNHIEHHICRATFPTTPGVALWETWAMGQSPFFLGLVGGSLPWFLLQSYFVGTNIVVHTMWPAKRLLQWHCLHHTILSDVYMSNIPSPYDKEHSKSVQKLQNKLEAISPFVKYEFLSDLIGFVFMTIAFVFFHYVLGIGASHEDWSKADVIYHHYTTTTTTTRDDEMLLAA